jgi:hypothetical protein
MFADDFSRAASFVAKLGFGNVAHALGYEKPKEIGVSPASLGGYRNFKA